MLFCQYAHEHFIVSYLSICKAPLIGRTVQKRSQCAKPSENKQVLRKAKEEERLSDRILERTEGERAFQRKGPIEAKERD